MADQPRYEPYEWTDFFEDNRASRRLVPGTVARGHLRTDAPYHTGRIDGEYVETFPPSLLAKRDMAGLLVRGRNRYDIYCAHCHGRVGGGNGGDPKYEQLVGMVVRRGFPAPPTYHQQRLREAPVGHLYDVITNGFRRMPRHDDQIPVDDRWAIVAYIRALQLSQYAPLDALTDEDRKRLRAEKSLPPVENE